MYSIQTYLPSTTSSTLTWGHQFKGWIVSSSTTASSLSQRATSSSNASMVIDIQVGAANGTFFDPVDVTVTLGALLRFHLLGQNCSLSQAFSNVCTNGSRDGDHVEIQTLNAVDKNGSVIFDYLVDTESPQWVYSAHSFPELYCELGSVFRINPKNEWDMASNSTRTHTELSNIPVPTQRGHGFCDVAPHTITDGTSRYGTGVSTVASASQTLRQPLATSFLPQLSNRGSKLSTHHYSLIPVFVVLAPFLVTLVEW